MAFSARNVFRNQNLREHEDPRLVNCLGRLRVGSDLPASPLRGPPPHSPPSRLPASVFLTNGHPPGTNKDGLPEALEAAAARLQKLLFPEVGRPVPVGAIALLPSPSHASSERPLPTTTPGQHPSGSSGKGGVGRGLQYQNPPQDGRKNRE